MKTGKMQKSSKKLIVLAIIVLMATLSYDTFSRYYSIYMNDSNLKLAPWRISVNNKKITTSENITVKPDLIVVTDSTTERYQNKLVPGCSGYFDLIIDPTGTGVSVDYIIDFKPEKLPGGMEYIKYDIIGETTDNVFPENYKIIGNMKLSEGNLLDSNDILKYRIYWNYKDDDELNKVIPMNNEEGIMVSISLKQSI